MTNGGVVQLPEIEVKPAPAMTPQEAQTAAGTDVTPGPANTTPGASGTADPNLNLLYPTRPDGSTEPYDVARIVVAGIDPYDDWESVLVHLSLATSSAEFRFTAVERDTPAGQFVVVQFVPGQSCQIYLGGVPVMNGFIETRQVAYDSQRHGIELSGKSNQAPVARSSVNNGDEGGSFDDMSFLEVAQKVLSKFTPGLKVVGVLDPTKFPKLSNQPGEMVWDFLERIARPRGIILGTDPFGNFVLIGEHNGLLANRQLIEGQNIKKCQCVITKQHSYEQYDVIGSTPGGDGQWGTQASQLKGTAKGTGYLQSILITPAEQPISSQGEADARARNEKLWHEGPEIELTITVQGWFRDDKNLWWPGDDVFVYSPMIPLNQVFKIQDVTFTQDNNSGTETTLFMKLPFALNDHYDAIDPEKPIEGAAPAVPLEATGGTSAQP